MHKRHRSGRGISSRSQQENYANTFLSWWVFNDDAATTKYAQLLLHKVESGVVVDWNFLRNEGLEQTFLQSFQTDEFTGPQWENLFRIQEPVYDELVHEFFATFCFDTTEVRNDVARTTIYFRLGASLGHAQSQSLVGD